MALRNRRNDQPQQQGVPLANLGISRPVGAVLLLLFFGLLGGLILARLFLGWTSLELAESFYRMGSLIFGGGQVVLPMMLTEVVDTGWVTEEQFLDGFALMLALPGPLFSFSAYLGAVYGGVPGALIAFAGLFLPGVLIIYAVLPFWEGLRRQPLARTALVGGERHGHRAGGGGGVPAVGQRGAFSFRGGHSAAGLWRGRLLPSSCAPGHRGDRVVGVGFQPGRDVEECGRCVHMDSK